MKRITLMEIARNNNYKISYKKYRYWDNVLFFNDTAICFDVIAEDNIEVICRILEYFPKFVTKEYIKNAIESNAESLGVIDYRNKHMFGGKIYFKYNEEMC